MEDNFRILVHRNDDKLHLRLEGTFDKNAARKLIGLLEGYAGKFSAVFIHTSGMNEVNPSSLAACRAVMMHMQGGSTMISVTGEYGAELMPGSLHFNSSGAPPAVQTSTAANV